MKSYSLPILSYSAYEMSLDLVIWRLLKTSERHLEETTSLCSSGIYTPEAQ